MREQKINSAIRDCLSGIYGREAILARMEEFLDNRRAKGELSEPELKAVETAVRHILYGIVDSMIYAGDATRHAAPDPQTIKVAGA